MDLKGLTIAPQTSWTQDAPCLYGAYRWLNGIPLHYFNTTISVRDLHTNVRLMSQIEGVEKWGFEALFQRSISWSRVDEIVGRYLKNSARFKFFPPVTLALLPVSDGRMHSDYSAHEMDVSDEGDFRVWRMKGLEIKFYTQGAEPRESGQIAMLKWDTSLFSAVAIDGQHRIAAIKEFRDSSHPDAAISDVPATFLVFDPRLPKDKHLLNLVREIFVDVNHNAKVVDESRIILLDDRDLIRRSARSCVLQSFDEQANPIPFEWKKLDETMEPQFLEGIPQELIDLTAGRQGADVKRLREWQYVSVFNLHRILKYFIFDNDWTTFENMLGLGNLTEEDGPLGCAVSAKRPDDEEDSVGTDDETFVFSPVIGEEILKNYFDSQVRPIVMGVLTGIKPYKKLLKTAQKHFEGEHGGDLREYLIAESTVDRSSSSALSENLQRNQPDLFAALVAMQKKIRRPDGWENDLIWYSVTQRALFSELPMIRKALEYFSDPEAPKTLPHFVDRYVKALSALWEAGVFERDYKPVGTMPLWFGSPLEARNGEIVIKPSDAAARRMARLIRILVAAFHAKENGWEPKDFFNGGFAGNSAGLKAAFTALRKNYEKYLKNDDASRGLKLKKDALYAASAERRLKNLVRKAVFQMEEEPDTESEHSETDSVSDIDESDGPKL
jgi:DGQHR domain-containing protein